MKTTVNYTNYNSSVFMSIRNVSTETSVQCHRVQCKPKAILRETHKTLLQCLNEQQICVNYLSLSTRLVRAHKNPAFDVRTWIWQERLNNTEVAVARQFYSTPGQRVRQIKTPHRDTQHSFSLHNKLLHCIPISTLTQHTKSNEKVYRQESQRKKCFLLPEAACI